MRSDKIKKGISAAPQKALLHALEVTEKENICRKKIKDYMVIRSIENPYSKEGGIAVLKGNLAPDGCVVKRVAVTENMMQHRGKAKVFDGEEPALNAIYAGEIQAGD